MKYNDNVGLDTSEVQDDRGSGGMNMSGFGGGGGMGMGLGLLPLVFGLFGRRGGRFGGGIVMLLVLGFLAFQFLGSSSTGTSNVLGSLGQPGQPATADNSQIQNECRTGADANNHLECAVIADINSIQDYWAAELPKLGRTYTPVDTVWFSGQVNTGCGAASSGTGPFYCPADKLVYIDLTFYNDLKQQFGAQGGLFVDAYVLAHEYGHHVQDLLGTEAKVRTRSGATSDSVRLELQADCYAGVWAKHATQTGPNGQPLITSITQDDINRALDAAKRIGDDYIQTNLGGGTVDTSKFTHGTSAQREKWFTTGFRTGEPTQCDTFSTNNLG